MKKEAPANNNIISCQINKLNFRKETSWDSGRDRYKAVCCELKALHKPEPVIHIIKTGDQGFQL